MGERALALLGADSTLRVGAAAREAELKAVTSPRVLHLATHGFFLADQEMPRTNTQRDDWLLAGAFATDSRGGMDGMIRTPPRPRTSDWENPLIRCGIALAGAK
jgi:hypothetical protein